MKNDIEKIRNFCIIAHIDHGKSTLADRFLEITHTISPLKMHAQYLDTLQLEQERGITIKLQTARMDFNGYTLNLIDTPGHVDFSYEVARSLAACEGAILLIDATQGVQAQTLSHAYLAIEHNLEIIPVINKIDIETAPIDEIRKEIKDLFGFKDKEIHMVSAKTGQGVEQLLSDIIQKIPAPKSLDEEDADSKSLIFDSYYDDHKGVVLLVRVKQGCINSNANLYFIKSNMNIKPIEIGYLHPSLEKAPTIYTGEVGYIATGLKDIKKIHVGDTVSTNPKAVALPSYNPTKSMVYASLFPIDTTKQEEFKSAIEKLALNDSALEYTTENSSVLGFGYKCGFLGMLHLDVIRERLSEEYQIETIITVPSVEYRIKLQGVDGEKIYTSALSFPSTEEIEYIKEPWVKLDIVSPASYVGNILSLVYSHKGEQKNTVYLSETRVLMSFELPFTQILTDFFDQLKSVTSGYASMDYELIDYRIGDIVKLSILVNYLDIEPFASLVHRDQAVTIGNKYVTRLAELIQKHQFKIPIQAAIGANIIARADIAAYRKDVTAKLYGGDVTRRMKLLEKQKRGKKRMKQFGNVQIPSEAFYKVLSSD